MWNRRTTQRQKLQIFCWKMQTVNWQDPSEHWADRLQSTEKEGIEDAVQARCLVHAVWLYSIQDRYKGAFLLTSHQYFRLVSRCAAFQDISGICVHCYFICMLMGCVSLTRQVALILVSTSEQELNLCVVFMQFQFVLYDIICSSTLSVLNSTILGVYTEICKFWCIWFNITPSCTQCRLLGTVKVQQKCRQLLVTFPSYFQHYLFMDRFSTGTNWPVSIKAPSFQLQQISDSMAGILKFCNFLKRK